MHPNQARPPRVFASLLALLALAFGWGGVQLLVLGGSWYYAGSALVLLLSASLVWRGSRWGAWLYGLLMLATVAWALWEVGLDGWALMPRLVPLAVIGLWFLTPRVRRGLNNGRAKPLTRSLVFWGGFAAAAALLVAVLSIGSNYEVKPVSAPASVATAVNSRGDWPFYGNTNAGTRYSPLNQINSENVGQLEVAWIHRTKVGGVNKNTPSQVGELLYTCNGGNIVQALDAQSGELRWQFNPQIDPQQLLRARYFTTTCRGVSYFEAPPDYSGDCKQRILMGTADARLFALDAHTGQRCASFGSNGEVDLSRQIGRDPPIFYFVTSAPAIVRGNAVVGGWVLDNAKVKSPSGVIRAFDALSGEFQWAWDMGRPNERGLPPEGETFTLGTPNVWSLFSVDEERGIVYGPTGNETPDYFGAQRGPWSEEFASSVVALNGETGDLVWSFQTVHHDIWDYDVPSQPVLIDLPNEEGGVTPALIQPTKRGEIFMLNRVTGEPIAEVKELPVPQGGVAEDWTALTQPFSVGMPNFRGPDLQEKDMWGVTPFDHMWCRIQFRSMRYEGHFTPPSTQYMIQYPGNAGGFNWGSVAVDEANHVMIASPMLMANRMRLIPRTEMEAGARGSAQAGTPYGATTEMFVSPLGVPCMQPPYGVLSAIDLRTREVLWKRPIGDAYTSGPWGIPSRLPITVGTPTAAGSIVTAGGLIFIGGTMDRALRAVDVKTGAELWRYRLPVTGQATPMMYMSPDGQQTLIMPVPAYNRNSTSDARSQDPNDEDPEGGYFIAFRLPKPELD